MDEDQNSILYQAIQQQMFPPQADLIAQKYVEPGSDYNMGVEVRITPQGSGTVFNPIRMMRQPTDFTGRPAQSNDNPARVTTDSPLGYGRTQVRPSPNVINQYQDTWEQQRIGNAVDRYNRMYNTEATPAEVKAVQDYYGAKSPSMIQRALHKIREFFNANRKPDWLD